MYAVVVQPEYKLMRFIPAYYPKRENEKHFYGLATFLLSSNFKD
jgi:hypothetical protein